MMDQHKRTCNGCGYEVKYTWIHDAHDPAPVAGFDAVMLDGEHLGRSVGTETCPQCKSELTMESTTKSMVVSFNIPHECPSSDANLLPGVAELATEIRKSSIDQKELWQLLPNLRLEAEGRSGWSDFARLTYEHGLWLIGRSPSSGARTPYAVECASGYLVWIRDYIEEGEIHFLDDESVLTLAGKLDAQSEVDRLRSHITEYENRPSFYSEEEWKKTSEFREEVREKTGLSEIFRREEITICGCKPCKAIYEILNG